MHYMQQCSVRPGSTHGNGTTSMTRSGLPMPEAPLACVLNHRIWCTFGICMSMYTGLHSAERGQIKVAQ